MVWEVWFVSNNSEDNLLSSLLHNSLMPIGYILIWILTSNIINNNSYLTILNISRNETLEPFLTSSVPKMQLISLFSYLNIFNRKVNSNGRRLVHIKRVLNVPLDNRTLTYPLVSKENKLEFLKRRECHVWVHKWGHLITIIFYKLNDLLRGYNLLCSNKLG